MNEEKLYSIFESFRVQFTKKIRETDSASLKSIITNFEFNPKINNSFKSVVFTHYIENELKKRAGK